ncbi:MAG: hypothetical protein U9P38_04345 [Campylobacterota bacterium]|nr:hypothetical protein [Campylobacterota bacterium]
MTSLKTLNIKKPIIFLKLLENRELIVVDSQTTVRYLEIDRLKVRYGFKLAIEQKYYKNRVIDFSGDMHHLVSISHDRKEARVYTTASTKIVAQIDRHHGEVSCVGIDPSGKYMFAAGDDGKTFGVDIDEGRLAFTLPHHIDMVNDIAFHKDANLVATASYDKSISIFNFKIDEIVQQLRVHSQQVLKIKFLTENRLFSVDSKATAIIWDIYSAKVLSVLQGIHDDITQVISIKEDKFLLLGTALGYIILYDLENYKLLSKKYIKLSSTILSLEFYSVKNQLIIGTEEGKLFFYNIYEGESYLKEL